MARGGDSTLTRVNPNRKAALMAVIEAGYAAGYGPRPLARMTGRSYGYINSLAAAMGLSLGTRNPKRDHAPAALAAALRAYAG